MSFTFGNPSLYEKFKDRIPKVRQSNLCEEIFLPTALGDERTMECTLRVPDLPSPCNGIDPKLMIRVKDGTILVTMDDRYFLSRDEITWSLTSKDAAELLMESVELPDDTTWTRRCKDVVPVYAEGEDLGDIAPIFPMYRAEFKAPPGIHKVNIEMAVSHVGESTSTGKQLEHPTDYLNDR